MLLQNVPVAQGPNFGLTFEPPASKPGDYVVLKAEMDCIIAFSACPQVTLQPRAACPRACIRDIQLTSSSELVCELKPRLPAGYFAHQRHGPGQI